MRKLIAMLLLAMPCLADVILEPPRDRTVTRVRITVTTGTDDLRKGSRVYAFVVLEDGRRIDSVALNCRKGDCDALAPKSRKTLVWTPEDFNPFVREDIHAFGLTFKALNGDEWDLGAVEVDARTESEGTKPLLKLTKPVHHFKGREEWQSPALR